MTRRTVSRRQFAAALGAAAGVGLAGCGAGTNNSTNATNATVGTVEEVTGEETAAEETETEGEATDAETETPEPPEATDDPAAAVEDGMVVVRVAHLSPDAPNVDVAVGGTEILTDIAYGSVSGYYVLEPGTYGVTMTAAGEEEAVFEQEIQFDNGAFTVAAFGEVSGQNQAFAVTPLEDRVEPPAEETAAVRVVHASPDAPPVSVGVAGGDGDEPHRRRSVDTGDGVPAGPARVAGRARGQRVVEQRDGRDQPRVRYHHRLPRCRQRGVQPHRHDRGGRRCGVRGEHHRRSPERDHRRGRRAGERERERAVRAGVHQRRRVHTGGQRERRGRRAPLARRADGRRHRGRH